MSDRWIANKFGLFDFWYYDEEEFELSNGKIIFRGTNGSGKSVTTQSFIPLLLDGDKRPSRLDPFGSSARKIENYLLLNEEKEEDKKEKELILTKENKTSTEKIEELREFRNNLIENTTIGLNEENTNDFQKAKTL